MSQTRQAFDWQGALTETYHTLTRQMIEHLPQLLGALALLVIGWVVAWLLRLVAHKLIRGLERLLLHSAPAGSVPLSSTRSYARLGGDIVFWSVLLFFIAASANLLGWKIFSGISTALLTYLPNVLTGLLIILAGFALSGVASSAVATTAESTGIAQAALLARIAQITVVLTAMIIGVEQLGINVAFLTTTLIVVAGVLLGGAALAFGLGARSFVANVIAIQTARKHYQLGQVVRLGDVQGYVLEMTSTMVILDTKQGKAAIPAQLFHEQVSEIIADTEQSSSSLLNNFFTSKGGRDESS